MVSSGCCREGAVVILTSTCPPQRGVDDWLSNSGEKRGKTENIRATKRPRVEQDGDATSAVAGLLHSKYRFGGVEDGHHVWEISLHPGCGREAACGQLCLQVIQDLKQGLASEHRVGAKWWMGSGGLLVPQVRELSALSAVSTMPLRGILLRPQQLRYFSSGCWPSGFHSPQFHDYLRASFDEVQLKAIEECVGFLGAEGEGRRARPVTLIQGPPGTGKTHTIRGVLNTWHLLQYQRHYASVDACILGTMQLSAADWDRDTLDMLETRLEAGEGVLPLPKILVCAPSNGATDELLRRGAQSSQMNYEH